MHDYIVRNLFINGVYRHNHIGVSLIDLHTTLIHIPCATNYRQINYSNGEFFLSNKMIQIRKRIIFVSYWHVFVYIVIVLIRK